MSTRKLKVWVVERDDAGYDEDSRAVVVAKSADEARAILLDSYRSDARDSSGIAADNLAGFTAATVREVDLAAPSVVMVHTLYG